MTTSRLLWVSVIFFVLMALPIESRGEEKKMDSGVVTQALVRIETDLRRIFSDEKLQGVEFVSATARDPQLVVSFGLKRQKIVKPKGKAKDSGSEVVEEEIPSLLARIKEVTEGKRVKQNDKGHVVSSLKI